MPALSFLGVEAVVFPAPRLEAWSGAGRRRRLGTLMLWAAEYAKLYTAVDGGRHGERQCRYFCGCLK